LFSLPEYQNKTHINLSADNPLHDIVSRTPYKFLLPKRYDGYKTKLRPYAFHFLEWCLSVADVALYSSSTDKSVNNFVMDIIPAKFRKSFLFVWDRSKVFPDPDYSYNSIINSYDTIKNINNVINYVNRLGKVRYTDDDIIFVDDSPFKMRFNPINSVILVPKFSHFHRNKNITSHEEVERDCLPFVAAEINKYL